MVVDSPCFSVVRSLTSWYAFLLLFFLRCLPRSSAAVSVTALLKWVTMESRSASSSTSIARGANLPPIVAWKALITVGSFSFSRSNLILGWVGFLEFLRRVWKVNITMSWSLPTSAPGNVLVLAVLIPEWNRLFHYYVVKWYCSNFRIIKAFFSGIQIVGIIMVFAVVFAGGKLLFSSKLVVNPSLMKNNVLSKGFKVTPCSSGALDYFRARRGPFTPGRKCF